MSDTPDPNVIDQQRRIVNQTRSHVGGLLALLADLDADMKAYNNLGLGDDNILLDEAFQGSGTNREDYRAAVVSLQAIDSLLKQGHGVNLSRFGL